MSARSRQDNLPRRRVRSIAFFDDGLHATPHPSAAKDEKRLPSGVYWKPEKNDTSHTRPIASTQLLGLVLLAAAIVLLRILLQGVDLFCSQSGSSLELCRTPWITTRRPTLDTLSMQSTPTTKTLQIITALNENSASLEFIGLAMHIIAFNASEIHTTMTDNVDLLDMPQSDTDGFMQTTNSAWSLAQSFSSGDYFYRHNALRWQEGGINELSSRVGAMSMQIDDEDSSLLAVKERLLQFVPYGARWSLTRNVTRSYLHFFEQQIIGTEDVIQQAMQADLELGNLLGMIGQAERKSASKSMHDAVRRLSVVRAGVQWVRTTVQLAVKHYKDLLLQTRKMARILKADVNAYDSVLPRKRVLPMAKLRQILELEAAQLRTYIATALEHEKVVRDISMQWMEGDDPSIVIHKLEAAMLGGHLDWW